MYCVEWIDICLWKIFSVHCKAIAYIRLHLLKSDYVISTLFIAGSN